MPEEWKIQLPPLTAREVNLLIMGLQANARNLEEYGPQSKIPEAEIRQQNNESRKLEGVLINSLSHDDRT